MMLPLGERIRFQADANFSHAILKGLRRRQPTMDLQTAESAGLAGVPDPEVLARAAAEGRILLSHDYHTMPRHFGDFLASGRHYAGVFLLHQTLPIGQAIELIELAWEASTPGGVCRHIAVSAMTSACAAASPCRPAVPAPSPIVLEQTL